jgi:D-alanyl-lipoteichoic acid acyltransferase DltB (MBOAT superfamily)
MPVYTRLFGAFLVTTAICYYLIGRLNIADKKKTLLSRILLILCDMAFYAYADVLFVPFLLYVAAVTYISGAYLKKTKTRWAFAVSAVLLLAPLVTLKTMDWLNAPGLFLPLGISFFSLQAFSYIYSVYKDEMPASDLLSVFLFVSFFPSVTSGPILRAKDLIPQFQSVHDFEYDRFTGGMKLIAWGLFKKLVLADNMAKYIAYVNSEVFEYDNVSGTALLLAAVMYSFQLYLDFSGYSDIVIGSAQMLGFDIKKNFDHPYLSKTVSEFWRRWHISLSSWLRDYVYFPLGGSRTKEYLVYRNLMIVFIVSGLWHGNGMTFLVWGILHGLFSCIDRFLRKKFDFKGSVVLTFCAVTFAWIFFAASSVENALFTIGSFARIPGEIQELVSGAETVKDLFLVPESPSLLLLLVGLVLYCIISIFTKNEDGLKIVGRQKGVLRWAMYFTLILVIMFLASSEPVNFIYNRF